VTFPDRGKGEKDTSIQEKKRPKIVHGASMGLPFVFCGRAAGKRSFP